MEGTHALPLGARFGWHVGRSGAHQAYPGHVRMRVGTTSGRSVNARALVSRRAKLAGSPVGPLVTAPCGLIRRATGTIFQLCAGGRWRGLFARGVNIKSTWRSHVHVSILRCCSLRVDEKTLPVPRPTDRPTARPGRAIGNQSVVNSSNDGKFADYMRSGRRRMDDRYTIGGSIHAAFTRGNFIEWFLVYYRECASRHSISVGL